MANTRDVSEDGNFQDRDVRNDIDLQEASSQNGAPTYEAIAIRAYELWIENGRQDGFHETDWTRAEKELRAKGEQPKEGASVSAR